MILQENSSLLSTGNWQHFNKSAGQLNHVSCSNLKQVSPISPALYRGWCRRISTSSAWGHVSKIQNLKRENTDTCWPSWRHLPLAYVSQNAALRSSEDSAQILGLPTTCQTHRTPHAGHTHQVKRIHLASSRAPGQFEQSHRNSDHLWLQGCAKRPFTMSHTVSERQVWLFNSKICTRASCTNEGHKPAPVLALVLKSVYDFIAQANQVCLLLETKTAITGQWTGRRLHGVSEVIFCSWCGCCFRAIISLWKFTELYPSGFYTCIFILQLRIRRLKSFGELERELSGYEHPLLLKTVLQFPASTYRQLTANALLSSTGTFNHVYRRQHRQTHTYI